MTRLLYIESSPRKKRSSSIKIAQKFLDSYRESHPDNEIEILDVWQKPLPAFDADVIDAKYAIMHGLAHTEAQRKSWHPIEQMIADFKKADRYLFSIPMWNFGIPYPLKHYFDILIQPSYTFSYSPDKGYEGLVKGKPAVIIYSRGGSYGPGSGAESLDFQKNYMEAILKFMGFTDIQSILVEPTQAPSDKAEQVIRHAQEEAASLAAQF